MPVSDAVRTRLVLWMIFCGKNVHSHPEYGRGMSWCIRHRRRHTNIGAVVATPVSQSQSWQRSVTSSTPDSPSARSMQFRAFVRLPLPVSLILAFKLRDSGTFHHLLFSQLFVASRVPFPLTLWPLSSRLTFRLTQEALRPFFCRVYHVFDLHLSFFNPTSPKLVILLLQCDTVTRGHTSVSSSGIMEPIDGRLPSPFHRREAVLGTSIPSLRNADFFSPTIYHFFVALNSGASRCLVSESR